MTDQPSTENIPPTDASLLQSMNAVSLEVVTEHLGFASVHFIDDLIDLVNSLLYKSMSKLESFVAAELGQGIETDKGMASIETLMENCVDKRFDRFEVFGLRNVFAIQPELAMQLSAFPECDLGVTPDQEADLDADIDRLRKQLLANKYMQSQLEEEELYLDDAVAHLNVFGSQLSKLESVAMDNNVYPLSEKLVELTTKISALHSVTEQVHIRTTHPIMRERIADSDRRMQLMQSEIATHIKKRRQISDAAASAGHAGDVPCSGLVATSSRVSAWDVTREYRDAMLIGSVKEMEAFKERLLL
ncbi:hypothetical protein BASA50_006831 [Batrachochytrium salamandrivorans]|uniref:Mis12 domain-containing protein n=1 Tax=Batrachochytrium salamandrivorans TaxID=1357716 RepID=A0ABQ8F8M6_9FUNG|nr:hypothetical protein BASA62_008076 [Batrachochytrium salamandrivorans]KAH6574807.1 hypothetical protein BASA60_005276 [Batrachochytrium salamandrivorans]KAH6594134.1 hypothetical protein BASA50_006831 [Batrachochytrium salamandrivorans]KAH6601703.1 hypothetical protein BASA61_001907 [Batrachochytrium salamandrivorans]KAH9273070.1 hypothetical protein BASA83_004647 [Batrachochytrium salamandrivorans]